MSEIYANDELFVYCNGDRWELGQVKRPNNTGDGYFCWYSTGDTAANTPVGCMHKLANAGWSHIERTCKVLNEDYKQAAEYWQRMYEEAFSKRTCHDTDENPWHFTCSACEYEQNGYEKWNYCPNCGCKVMGE